MAGAKGGVARAGPFHFSAVKWSSTLNQASLPFLWCRLLPLIPYTKDAPHAKPERGCCAKDVMVDATTSSNQIYTLGIQSGIDSIRGLSISRISQSFLFLLLQLPSQPLETYTASTHPKHQHHWSANSSLPLHLQLSRFTPRFLPLLPSVLSLARLPNFRFPIFPQ